MSSRLDIPCGASLREHQIFQLELENLISRNTDEIVLVFGSEGPMPPSAAMAYVRLLQKRQRGTRLVTISRVGLHETEAAVWLQGDVRELPADSWLLFRSLQPAPIPEENKSWDQPVATSVADPGLVLHPDLASIHRILEEHVPLSDLVGRVVRGEELADLQLSGDDLDRAITEAEKGGIASFSGITPPVNPSGPVPPAMITYSRRINFLPN